jgi:2-polyprenyl-3-methyl-5-hydroxy-6-metoxy-1,4-benzoquinol methylase
LSALTSRRFGIEKAVVEPSRLRRLGYQLIGEIHIPGRIRLNHVIGAVNSFGLPASGIQMLDAGTGRGDLALYFSRMRPGWRVTGIDIEEDRVERCRAAAQALGLSNVNFGTGDLCSLQDRERYDLITSSDVLEHIDEDHLAVANLAKALKPGGRLLLTFPSVPQRRHLRLVGWRERRIGFTPADIGHVRQGYSPERINALLREAGLRTLEVRWTYGPFGNLAHDIFFVIGDSKPHPVAFAAALPLLLLLSFLEGHTPIRHGSGLLVTAAKD